MAGSEGSKYYNIFLDYNVWLKHNASNEIFDDSKINLLRKIAETSSIKAAAEKCKISYRKAWGDIIKAEKMLGFNLVDKSRGGKKGGKTILSANGQELVNAFNELHDDINETIKKITKKFFHNINK